MPSVSASGPSDKELLNKIILRDQDAFQLLYRRYSPVIYGVAVRIVKSESIASEILRSVFEKIWNQPDTYVNSTLRLSSLLFRQTRRESRKRRQSDTNSPRLPNPQLDKLLEGLHANEAFLIKRIFSDGSSLSEIAEETGTPVADLRRILRSATRSIRALSAGEQPAQKSFTLSRPSVVEWALATA